MRAAGVETFGGEVQILELPAPQSLAPDEVVITVRAAGVGNWDEIVRVGGWDVGRQPPLVLGGMLSLHLGATVPLAEAAAALQTASAGRASGATVLTLSHSPETLPQNH